MQMITGLIQRYAEIRVIQGFPNDLKIGKSNGGNIGQERIYVM